MVFGMFAISLMANHQPVLIANVNVGELLKCGPSLMKFFSIGLAALLAWASLGLTGGIVRAEEPCKGYTQDMENPYGYGYEEINNCPLTRDDVSISGDFTNENWQVYLAAWEPGSYVYRSMHKQGDTSTRVIDFDITGTTERPQYRFSDGDLTHIITFRYSDPETIRLEIYTGDRLLVNELLTHDPDLNWGHL